MKFAAWRGTSPACVTGPQPSPIRSRNSAPTAKDWAAKALATTSRNVAPKQRRKRRRRKCPKLQKMQRIQRTQNLPMSAPPSASTRLNGPPPASTRLNGAPLATSRTSRNCPSATSATNLLTRTQPHLSSHRIFLEYQNKNQLQQLRKDQTAAALQPTAATEQAMQVDQQRLNMIRVQQVQKDKLDADMIAIEDDGSTDESEAEWVDRK